MGQMYCQIRTVKKAYNILNISGNAGYAYMDTWKFYDYNTNKIKTDSYNCFTELFYKTQYIILTDNLIENNQKNFDNLVYYLMKNNFSQQHAINVASIIPVVHLENCYNYELILKKILDDMKHKGIKID
jgi:hypothetical protein